MNRHFSYEGIRMANRHKKQVWRFLKKLKIEVPYDSVIALLGIYPKQTKILVQRDARTPVFIAALSTIAKLWKQPKCPSTDEWLKMKWYIFIMNITQP